MLCTESKVEGCSTGASQVRISHLPNAKDDPRKGRSINCSNSASMLSHVLATLKLEHVNIHLDPPYLVYLHLFSVMSRNAIWSIYRLDFPRATSLLYRVECSFNLFPGSISLAWYIKRTSDSSMKMRWISITMSLLLSSTDSPATEQNCSVCFEVSSTLSPIGNYKEVFSQRKYCSIQTSADSHRIRYELSFLDWIQLDVLWAFWLESFVIYQSPLDSSIFALEVANADVPWLPLRQHPFSPRQQTSTHCLSHIILEQWFREAPFRPIVLISHIGFEHLACKKDFRLLFIIDNCLNMLNQLNSETLLFSKLCQEFLPKMYWFCIQIYWSTEDDTKMINITDSFSLISHTQPQHTEMKLCSIMIHHWVRLK